MIEPHDVVLERALLGAILLYPESLKDTAKGVRAEHFYLDVHKSVFSAIEKLKNENKHIDVVTVGSELVGKIPDHVHILKEIAASSGSERGIYQYSERLALLYRKRHFTSICTRLAHVAGNGSDASEISALWSEAEVLAKAGLSSTPSPVETTDISKLLSLPAEPPWICKPFIAQDDVTIFGAMYGTGKSWTAYGLALSVCSSHPFMDIFEIQLSGPSIYFDFENPPTDLARILRQLPQSSVPSSFHLVHMPKFKIDTPDGIATLQRYIDEIQPALIVIDSLSKVHTKIESRPEQIGPVMYSLQCLARENHCSILILHHYGKITEFSRTPESRLRGTTAIGDNADAIFSLQTTKERTIRMGHEKARHGKKIEAFEYAIEDDLNGKTRLVVKEMEVTSAAVDRAKEVRDWVALQGEPTTKSMLYDEFVSNRGWSESTLKRAVKAAEERFLLDKSKKNNMVQYTVGEKKGDA